MKVSMNMRVFRCIVIVAVALMCALACGCKKRDENYVGTPIPSINNGGRTTVNLPVTQIILPADEMLVTFDAWTNRILTKCNQLPPKYRSYHVEGTRLVLDSELVHAK